MITRPTPTERQFNFGYFADAAHAQGQEASVIVRNGTAIFTLTDHGQTIELTTAEAAQFVLRHEENTERDAEYSAYLESLPFNKVANAPTMAEYFGEVRKQAPKVSVTVNVKRPTIGKLGDVLKETVDHAPDGFTCITGSTASRWYDLQEARDTLYLEIDGVTACIDVNSDVTVFIRQGVTVDHARALLKAMAAELKTYPSLEPFTPLVPVSLDAVPF